MPLPETHVTMLERLLKEHDDQVTTLTRSLKSLDGEIARRKSGDPGPVPNAKMDGIPVLEAQRASLLRRIEAHEALMAFGRDQRNRDALSEFFRNPDLARKAAADQTAFVKSRGLVIPASLDIAIDVMADNVAVRFTNMDEAAPFMLVWNEQGFSLPRRPGV